jgi:hypothetical protein
MSFTEFADYGLTAHEDRVDTWNLVRISTVSSWLVFSLFIWLARKRVEVWRSFAYSAAMTTFLAMLAAENLAGEGSNYFIVFAAICFYALLSGFLCITLKKSWIAALLGLLLFPLQLALDALVHLYAGNFSIH